MFQRFIACTCTTLLSLSIVVSVQAAETLLKFGPGFDLAAVAKSDVQVRSTARRCVWRRATRPSGRA